MVEEGEDAATVLPGSPAALIDYRAVTAPIAIIAGERDQVAYPIRHAKRLAAMLPDATLTMQRDTGHMLHHIEPGPLFEALDRLIAG